MHYQASVMDCKTLDLTWQPLKLASITSDIGYLNHNEIFAC